MALDYGEVSRFVRRNDRVDMKDRRFSSVKATGRPNPLRERFPRRRREPQPVEKTFMVPSFRVLRRSVSTERVASGCVRFPNATELGTGRSEASRQVTLQERLRIIGRARRTGIAYGPRDDSRVSHTFALGF